MRSHFSWRFKSSLSDWYIFTSFSHKVPTYRSGARHSSFITWQSRSVWFLIKIFYRTWSSFPIRENELSFYLNFSSVIIWSASSRLFFQFFNFGLFLLIKSRVKGISQLHHDRLLSIFIFIIHLEKRVINSNENSCNQLIYCLVSNLKTNHF